MVTPAAMRLPDTTALVLAPLPEGVEDAAADVEDAVLPVGAGVTEALDPAEALVPEEPVADAGLAVAAGAALPCTRKGPCVPRAMGVESYPFPTQSATPFAMVQLMSRVIEISGKSSTRCASFGPSTRIAIAAATQFVVPCSHAHV